jgi:hypothetical protein
VALRFDYRGCGDSEGERGRVIPVEEVADARNAVTYMAERTDVDPDAIALCGSSLGGGVAVQAAGLDPRVAAVIVENGVANGERMIRNMHSAESWAKFRALLDDIAAHRERTGTTKMIHRFDIFEMPKSLQVNLTSNESLMQFTGETAIGFFMFRPEEFVARIGPQPILILHSATDIVTNYEEAFSLVRRAKPPVELHLLDGRHAFHVRQRRSARRAHLAQLARALFPGAPIAGPKTNILPREAREDDRRRMVTCAAPNTSWCRRSLP